MEYKEELQADLFSPQDLMQMEARGITPDKALEQVRMISEGTPYPEIITSASLDRGIVRIDLSEKSAYLDLWEDYMQSLEANVTKMVPASGAATRMFKDLYAFLEAPYDIPQTESEQLFFERIQDFAFYGLLNEACLRNNWRPIQKLVSQEDFKLVVKNLLQKDGINYGNLPKGLLLFHKGLKHPRTAVEEHMVEAAIYTRPNDGLVKLHFTVSTEHREAFMALIEKKKIEYEDYYCVRYDISLSEQKSSTDTIALTPQGEIFRLPEGEMLFRPGGHGALIQNLNDLDADIVFIKNIDNVVPEEQLCDTIVYKKLLGGILVALRRQVFAYVGKLKQAKTSRNELNEIYSFLRENFAICLPDVDKIDDNRLQAALLSKLDRPLRVCGMVKNEGEPGGGPFIIREPDGSSSLQILESSQIDTSREDQLALFREGSFFNPVDLVCSKLRPEGGHYDLNEFVNAKTAFVSEKTYNGKPLLGLELPGLWNGGMHHWLTLFVEVPLTTFSPVKEVNDLLDPVHQ
ncbi:NAD metabolism ATPase/kinase [Porphyromonas crevioricanis]|uniref:NAD metabolism ATPase/kinase n=2 Tax=Porphyromonas crevioricanis TaxID=393921 RepID=A0A0A2FKR5_9PORP|nr:DUF4301 family protein [Porphyromonas crevioricanis]KGN88854.1 NAD metabolism ATPase/kinase [Porphyromonas crevioricanis]KGN95872.1 NAD metabolism ATPase/kinase [Porphyromonas crevioricanis]SJZ73017.1 protein of unknown function [Porphyromonas crevioricanis]SQH73508.1 Predicted ATPase/kinase involved in NAD metabolism [Porphyromonas crevioricanis]GAD06182.1 ribosylnicotinamide kinase homolog [Porphyromonas crevioricanis JCM 15906]